MELCDPAAESDGSDSSEPSSSRPRRKRRRRNRELHTLPPRCRSHGQTRYIWGYYASPSKKGTVYRVAIAHQAGARWAAWLCQWLCARDWSALLHAGPHCAQRLQEHM